MFKNYRFGYCSYDVMFIDVDSFSVFGVVRISINDDEVWRVFGVNWFEWCFRSMIIIGEFIDDWRSERSYDVCIWCLGSWNCVVKVDGDDGGGRGSFV